MKNISNRLNLTTVKWMMNYIQPFKKQWTIYTFIKSISGLFGVVIALSTKKLIDAATSGDTRAILFPCIILSLILLIELFLKSLRTYQKTKLSQAIRRHHQRKLISKLLSIQWQSYTKYLHGDLMNRISSDIGSVNGIWLNTIPTIISLTVQFCCSFVTLLIFDPKLSLMILIISPAGLAISWMIGRHLKPLNQALIEARSKYKAYLADILNHTVIIKTFQSEASTLSHFGELQDQRYDISMKKTHFKIFSSAAITIGYNLSLLAIFIWGSYQISMGLLTFGTFTAYLQLIGQIQGPMDTMGSQISSIISMSASAERLIELESLPDDAIISPLTQSASSINQLVVHDLDFYYSADKVILRNVSLCIDNGEKIALIGASGEGKTTFIRLLLGLITPVKGSIEFNHTEINASTRSLFSYVPQGDTLFFGTIRDNLLIAKADAKDHELYSALEMADLKKFVLSLPNGLDTFIGENLSGLAQGQAQRLCIARACLRDAPVMLLDEATSSLDPDSESRILSNIFKSYNNKIIIVISHKPSVINLVTRIYRLENGRLRDH